MEAMVCCWCCCSTVLCEMQSNDAIKMLMGKAISHTRNHLEIELCDACVKVWKNLFISVLCVARERAFVGTADLTKKKYWWTNFIFVVNFVRPRTVRDLFLENLWCGVRREPQRNIFLQSRIFGPHAAENAAEMRTRNLTQFWHTHKFIRGMQRNETESRCIIRKWCKYRYGCGWGYLTIDHIHVKPQKLIGEHR